MLFSPSTATTVLSPDDLCYNGRGVKPSKTPWNGWAIAVEAGSRAGRARWASRTYPSVSRAERFNPCCTQRLGRLASSTHA